VTDVQQDRDRLRVADSRVGWLALTFAQAFMYGRGHVTEDRSVIAGVSDTGLGDGHSAGPARTVIIVAVPEQNIAL